MSKLGGPILKAPPSLTPPLRFRSDLLPFMSEDLPLLNEDDAKSVKSAKLWTVDDTSAFLQKMGYPDSAKAFKREVHPSDPFSSHPSPAPLLALLPFLGDRRRRLITPASPRRPTQSGLETWPSLEDIQVRSLHPIYRTSRLKSSISTFFALIIFLDYIFGIGTRVRSHKFAVFILKLQLRHGAFLGYIC